MTRDVQIVDEHTGELVERQATTFEDVQMLDPYAAGVAHEPARIDALATISAGYREPGKDGHVGLPKASRDGTIYLHDPNGRAPGLKAALEAGGGKRLTIAFPFNNPNAFIQQRFVRYSATKLEVYGDERVLYEIVGSDHIPHVKDDPDDPKPQYRQLVKTCKNNVSFYFALAEWGDMDPRMIFPDGLGFYRGRFTSRHSLRNLRAAVAEVALFTSNRIAGIPFDLALDYREVADPTGTKRTIPCFTFTMHPPQVLTSRTFALNVGKALKEGAALMLPPPSAETLEYAELEGPEPDLDEPSEDAVRRMTQGGRCDPEFWEAKWFALVRGTRYDADGGRASFILQYTQGETASLAAFLDGATEGEANDLIEAMGQTIVEDTRREVDARLTADVAATRATAAARGRRVRDTITLPDDDERQKPPTAPTEPVAPVGWAAPTTEPPVGWEPHTEQDLAALAAAEMGGGEIIDGASGQQKGYIARLLGDIGIDWQTFASEPHPFVVPSDFNDMSVEDYQRAKEALEATKKKAPA